MKALTTTLNAPPPTRRRGLFARILYWLLDLDDITVEEARERMRSRPSFLDTLSPETLEYLRNYDGPEVLGPPLTKRERRRMAAQS